MPDLKGKVALITGAGSGIGRATAIHFTELGCKLVINDINLTNLQTTYEECLNVNSHLEDVGHFLLQHGDITNEEFCQGMVKKTIEEFGRLDVLVNNAGMNDFGAVDVYPMERLDKLFELNYKAYFRMTQLVMPHLKASKGNIVNVSSVQSTKALLDMSAYASLKSAVDNFTKATAREVGPHGVRVNSVNPGGVYTDINIHAGWTNEDSRKLFEEELPPKHALQRVARSEEIAKPIAFLASDDASFVTGTNFLVDGGFSLGN